MHDFKKILRDRLLVPVSGASGAAVEIVETGDSGSDAPDRLEVGWGYARGPFGDCSIGWCDRGICHLAFEGEGGGPPESLRSDWPNAAFRRDDAAARKLAGTVFAAGRTAGKPLRVAVRGTPFQLKVWRALLGIPEGRVASYGMVARAIGAPKAARAVGAACGANRVAYLIPCHRVVHGNGSTTGYRWGAARKNALLEREFRIRLKSGAAS